MKNVHLFLELLTKRLPPMARHAHSLTLQKGKLQLNLVTVAPCWKFIFSDEDLQKEPQTLVAEIARLVPPKDSPTSVA
jgi:hypothetical protein